MRYWLNVGFLELDHLVPVAQAAERLGFKGVTLPDHLFFPADVHSRYPYSDDGSVSWPTASPWPDCWVSIAVMAAATEQLEFSTGVFVAPLRDPFSLAKVVGTVAGFAGGRLSCGFGSGWLKEEFDIVGIDFASRGSRLNEMLEVLRLLWTGEMVEFHGRHFEFGPIQMRPAAGTIPIVIGGNSPVALRRAAANDGWIGTHTNVADVGRMVAEIRQQRAEAGVDHLAFDFAVTGGPRLAAEAAALSDVGIGAVTIPVVALAASPELEGRLAGLERFAERWIR